MKKTCTCKSLQLWWLAFQKVSQKGICWNKSPPPYPHLLLKTLSVTLNKTGLSSNKETRKDLIFGIEEHPPLFWIPNLLFWKGKYFPYTWKEKFKAHIFCRWLTNLVEISNCQIILHFYWWYKQDVALHIENEKKIQDNLIRSDTMPLSGHLFFLIQI